VARARARRLLPNPFGPSPLQPNAGSLPRPWPQPARTTPATRATPGYTTYVAVRRVTGGKGTRRGALGARRTYTRGARAGEGTHHTPEPPSNVLATAQRTPLRPPHERTGQCCARATQRNKSSVTTPGAHFRPRSEPSAGPITPLFAHSSPPIRAAPWARRRATHGRMPFLAKPCAGRSRD